MKVAIAVEGQRVAPHFGRCQGYLIADVTDGRVGAQRHVPNPGHEPGVLPALLWELGVGCVIAGGMGPRARQMFDQYGISTIVGVVGTAHEALSQFASGTLKEGESLCDH